MSGPTNVLGTNVSPQKDQKWKKPSIPEGFSSYDEFLKDMREKYDNGTSYDSFNTQAAADDIQFCCGIQWDPTVKAQRIKARKPVLEINRLPAFVAQVVNQRLMNETEIRVLPDSGGDKAIAELREGIIRSIFYNSDADFARDEAMKYQITCGIGWYTLGIDYASDDVFEQDIKIKAIANPFAVTMDPMAIEPSGADASYAFVDDEIPTKDFRKLWPGAPAQDWGSNSNWSLPVGWFTEDTVRVTSYWQMVYGDDKLLALMIDGSVQDVTGLPEGSWEGVCQKRANGALYTRTVRRKIARMYLCTGATVLEGPHDYELSSIPVFRVPGWEYRLNNQTFRWGLVRFLKDPMRLHNYFRSVIAEQLTAAPRNKYVATKGAVQGYEKLWQAANQTDDQLLLYNEDSQPPVPMPVPQADAALLQQADAAVQDIRDVSNIHEASLGIVSNEVSGKAIQARQQVSDVSTFIYTDRQMIADRRCAVLLNELIPQIYDTQRQVKVMGRDNQEVLALINDPMQPNSDVTVGKYRVSVTTGPSTVTKRQLAADQMQTFVNAMPQVAPLVMDLIAEAQDWPQSDEFAKRFRSQLPPGVAPPTEQTPEQQQAQAEAQQQQQMMQQMAIQKFQTEMALQQAKVEEARAKALQAQANAQKAVADAGSNRIKAEADHIDAVSTAEDRAVYREHEETNSVLKQYDAFQRAVETSHTRRMATDANDRDNVRAAMELLATQGQDEGGSTQ